MFAREFLTVEAGFVTFANADLIAAGLSPFDPARAAIQAGRLMLQEITGHVAHGENFVLETLWRDAVTPAQSRVGRLWGIRSSSRCLRRT